jgi:hypothetical protein
MANRNSRRAAKERSKEFASIRKGGHEIANPPSQRTSHWRGHKTRVIPAMDGQGVEIKNPNARG